KLTALRYARDKDPAAARAGYQEAIALDPACPLPYLHLGRLADAEEKWEEAATNFTQFIKLDAVSDDSVQTQLRMDDLKKLLEQDKTPEGKRSRLYEAALARIRAASSEGRLEDAAKEATAAVQIDPQRVEAYAQGAAALAKQERFAEAQPLLKKALELAAADKKPAIQAALDQCEKELQGAALAKAASDSLDAKNYDQAQKKFAEAFTLLPSREAWGLSAALAAGMAEDYHGCKQLLQKLTAAQDASIAEQARNRLAKVEDLLTEREVQGAELRAKARSSDDLMTLGNRFEEGNGVPKDAHQAFLCYQAAVESGKWSRDWAKTKALLKMEQVFRDGRGTSQDEAKAAECFQKAVAIVKKPADDNPKDPRNKLTLASFYTVRSLLWPTNVEGSQAAAKDKAEALTMLNSAVDLGYRDYQRVVSDADLQPLQSDSQFQATVQQIRTLVAEEARKRAEEQARKEGEVRREKERCIRAAFKAVAGSYWTIIDGDERAKNFLYNYTLQVDDDGVVISNRKYNNLRKSALYALEYGKGTPYSGGTWDKVPFLAIEGFETSKGGPPGWYCVQLYLTKEYTTSHRLKLVDQGANPTYYGDSPYRFIVGRDAMKRVDEFLEKLAEAGVERR
ncbi:MAG TPA: hypothetical protein VI136_24105, partial [Verrucomicrobiae bacterium]